MAPITSHVYWLWNCYFHLDVPKVWDFMIIILSSYGSNIAFHLLTGSSIVYISPAWLWFPLTLQFSQIMCLLWKWFAFGYIYFYDTFCSVNWMQIGHKHWKPQSSLLMLSNWERRNIIAFVGSQSRLAKSILNICLAFDWLSVIFPFGHSLMFRKKNLFHQISKSHSK